MSKQLYNTHIGYAVSQEKKMLTKNVYLGYMGKKRKALVDRLGYDAKMASHTVRLLRSGIEALSTGNMSVYRKADAEELVNIKKGMYSLEHIQTLISSLFLEAKEAMLSSKLPEKIDASSVDALIVDIFKTYLYK